MSRTVFPLIIGALLMTTHADRVQGRINPKR